MTTLSDYDCILCKVLGQKVDSPTSKPLARAGVDDVGGFTTLSVGRVEKLKFVDGADAKATLQALPDGSQQRLLCFQAFVKTKISQGMKVYKDWQNLVTKDDFNEFRLNVYDPND